MLVALALGLVLSEPPTAMSGHAGAVANGEIYVVGGMGKPVMQGFFPTLWQIKPSIGEWSALPDIKIPRAMAGAAFLDGSLYVAGGFDWSNKSLVSVERFDTRTGRWVDVAPLIKSRIRFPLVALVGKLYAVSGMKGEPDGSDHINTAAIDEYDPAKNAWREAGSLNHARHGFAVAVWHERIYVFGGNDGESERSAECWDPSTGKSTDLPDMPIPRGFGGAVVYGDRIICFGGRQSFGKAHPSAFDPLTNSWTELSVPDIDLNRFVGDAIDGKLWLVGGESADPKANILRSIDLKTWK